MKRKLIAFFLSLLLLCAVPLSAAADAYIPPERVSGFDMNYAYMENGTCKALNTYLSNFVEMGLEEYSAFSSDSDLIPAVLKHLELNAGYYAKYVKKYTEEDGNTYMRIDGSFFTQRAEHLFGRSIPAKSCPGYDDGRIKVSADHFGGPIQVFGSVYGCYPLSGDQYEVYFEAFRIDKDFSGWYSTAHANLPWDNLTSLGTGTAVVEYAGGKTDKTIATSDFTLVEFYLDAQGIPCMGANLPYGYIEPTEPPTEAPTEAPTAAPTEAPTRPAATQPAREPEKEPVSAPTQRDNPPKVGKVGNDLDITMVLVIILVVAVVLLALLIIIFLITKKKSPSQPPQQAQSVQQRSLADQSPRQRSLDDQTRK